MGAGDISYWDLDDGVDSVEVIVSLIESLPGYALELQGEAMGIARDVVHHRFGGFETKHVWDKALAGLDEEASGYVARHWGCAPTTEALQRWFRLQRCLGLLENLASAGVRMRGVRWSDEELARWQTAHARTLPKELAALLTRVGPGFGRGRYQDEPYFFAFDADTAPAPITWGETEHLPKLALAARAIALKRTQDRNVEDISAWSDDEAGLEDIDRRAAERALELSYVPWYHSNPGHLVALVVDGPLAGRCLEWNSSWDETPESYHVGSFVAHFESIMAHTLTALGTSYGPGSVWMPVHHHYDGR